MLSFFLNSTLNKSIKQLKLNCGTFPKPEPHLRQIYNEYITLEKINDQGFKLRDGIISINRQAIFREFNQLLNSICNKMSDEQNIKIKRADCRKRLDLLIDNQIPQKLLLKQQHQQPQIIKKNSYNDAKDFPIELLKSGELFITYLHSKFKQISSIFINYYQINEDQNQLRRFDKDLMVVLEKYRKAIEPSFLNSLSQLVMIKKKSSTNFEFEDEKKKIQQKKKFEQMVKILDYNDRSMISMESGLSSSDYLTVQNIIIQLELIKNYWDLAELFSSSQKDAVGEILGSAISCSKDCLQIDRQNLIEFASIFQQIKSKSIKSQKSTTFKFGSLKSDQLPSIFYLIYMLYRHFEKSYSPSARRLLVNISHLIENNYKDLMKVKNGFFSLIHSVKIIQSSSINVPGSDVRQRNIYDILTNQAVLRQDECSSNPSGKSCFQSFQDLKNTQTQAAQNQLEKHLKTYIKDESPLAKMRLFKMTQSKYRKNITILISGFLSQDTDKFQDWMGLIESTYDSEIYGLVWQSSSQSTVLQYLPKTGQKIVRKLQNAVQNLIGLQNQQQPNRSSLISHIVRNPFNLSFGNAQKTGQLLAQLIADSFEGHFVNLIGFSLGTQVILSALERLKKLEKLHMIDKVITMGGVADTDGVYEFLRTTEQVKENPISIEWTNLYCDRDLVLKTILPTTKKYIKPIGLFEIPSLKGNLETYKVRNYSVTDYINGHLDYKDNLIAVSEVFRIKDL